MLQRGVTLIELVVVLAVMAIAVALAGPSFSNLIENNKLTSNANQIIGAMNLARVEAVKRAAHVAIGPSAGGTDWSGGFQVWIDLPDGSGNYNNSYDSATESAGLIRVYEALSEGITVTGSTSSVVFRATGFASSAASVTLCGSNTAGRSIGVSASGRVNSTDHTCP